MVRGGARTAAPPASSIGVGLTIRPFYVRLPVQPSEAAAEAAE